MLPEEIEEYWTLLRQLEQTPKDESNNSSEDTSQLVQYFWCDKQYALVLIFFTNFDVF